MVDSPACVHSNPPSTSINEVESRLCGVQAASTSPLFTRRTHEHADAMMRMAAILVALSNGAYAHTIGSGANGVGALMRLRGGEAAAAAPAAEALAPVTEKEVLEVQKNWANAIVKISAVHKAGGDYVGEAAKAAGELYAYGFSNVLFKPTKARKVQFRPTAGEAMSYFVGGSVVEKGYDEDKGFAINGGKGHKKCVYKNHQVEIKNGIGIAMGTYDFTCATTGNVDSVEYTFGYMRCPDNKVRIFLHHSSLPYPG